jgi:hypothetical protein
MLHLSRKKKNCTLRHSQRRICSSFCRSQLGFHVLHQLAREANAIRKKEGILAFEKRF